MRLELNLLAPEEANSTYRRRGIRGVLFRLLPVSAYDWLRGARLRFMGSRSGQITQHAHARYLSLISKSGVLSGLHYAFFSREFDREHRAVLAARGKHIVEARVGGGNQYRLRRNIHRLEKGLIMVPPRPVFGLAMIDETVDVYDRCCQSYAEGQDIDLPTLDWSRQILQSYFDRVSAHPIVDRAAQRFAAIGHAVAADNRARVPFQRTEGVNLPSIGQIEALAEHRRSVRWFADRPVPRDVIDRALAVANYSPSACNRQPYRFEIFDAKEWVQKVGSVPKGTPGWLHQIPAFAVIVAKLDAFRFERDRHVPYIDGSLAAMSLIYALEVQGVSSCCVNFPDFAETEKAMAAAIGLPPWERAVMCLAIGYPDHAEKVPHSQKLDLASMRRFNCETATDLT